MSRLGLWTWRSTTKMAEKNIKKKQDYQMRKLQEEWRSGSIFRRVHKRQKRMCRQRALVKQYNDNLKAYKIDTSNILTFFSDNSRG